MAAKWWKVAFCGMQVSILILHCSHVVRVCVCIGKVWLVFYTYLLNRYVSSGVEFAFGQRLIQGMQHQLDMVLLHSWGHPLEVLVLGGL